MSVEIEVIESRRVSVKYLKVEAMVRYWEDAEVNGVDDDDGKLIPCRNGDCWCPLIDLDAGRVLDWPEGTTADIHYKVCDAGVYTLLDDNRNKVASKDGYVPSIMAPGGEGYGDYIIMKIDGDGKIADWKIDLSDLTDGEE